jgi:hypothetical protein
MAEAKVAPLPKTVTMEDADDADCATTVEDTTAEDAPAACRRLRLPVVRLTILAIETADASTLNCDASAVTIAALVDCVVSCATETPENVTFTLIVTGKDAAADELELAAELAAGEAVELELSVTVTFCTVDASMPKTFGTAHAMAMIPTLENAGMLDTKDCRTADPK